jgi:hypothetical protein
MGDNSKRNRFNKSADSSNRYNYDPKTEVKIQNHKHPVFCFKYLVNDFDIDSCKDEDKLHFINQISKLSKLSWQEIQYTGRHALGTEKIPTKSIKVGLPEYITEDVEFLLSFRFQGKKPFLVYRDKFIAHVIFIDPKFRVYNH